MFIIKVNDHTLTISEDGKFDTASIPQAVIALGLAGAELTKDSSSSVRRRVKEPDFEETRTEYAVDRLVGHEGKVNTVKYKIR